MQVQRAVSTVIRSSCRRVRYLASAATSSPQPNLDTAAGKLVEEVPSGTPLEDQSVAADTPAAQSLGRVFEEHYDGALLGRNDQFLRRHLGTTSKPSLDRMLQVVGDLSSLEQLVEFVVPRSITAPDDAVQLPEKLSESEALAELMDIAQKNVVKKSLLGMGYHGTLTPNVIKRNMLENPGWYTSYTPYQAEISQGRLEMLLNFQTMMSDLVGMEVCNASLLDESTAAAEAMSLAAGASKNRKANKFFVASDCHPQTIDVVKTRAELREIEVVVGNPAGADFSGKDYFGALVQYPSTYGSLAMDGSGSGPAGASWEEFANHSHEHNTVVVAAADPLAMAMVKPPGVWGADVVVGSAQRFGVPMGYGGPHAGFMATKEKWMRKLPGRVIGVSVDSRGQRAYRLTMQTREQHIRRDKATSNICTAQALLANVAAAYGVYHGAEGLHDIALRVRTRAGVLARIVQLCGHTVVTEDDDFFDTILVKVNTGDVDELVAAMAEAGFNIRRVDGEHVGFTVDETTTTSDLMQLATVLGWDDTAHSERPDLAGLARGVQPLNAALARSTDMPYMTHEVFKMYHSETAMMRYLARLQSRDVSLVHSMVPLGSCTMKLNAVAQLEPILWNEFANVHPFAPPEQARGYAEMMEQLSGWLASITGFHTISFQPNSGAAGEFSGLRAIRRYLDANGGEDRNICLVPSSAHGTNPASAVMAGMKVVVVKNDSKTGEISSEDLEEKLAKHAGKIAAIMVTYPSTYGVFEDGVKELCQRIHDAGGMVYMDGANMNAQCVLTSPGFIGADVCHLNLHKTFCIPHGGGGPGVGAIGVNDKLAPFLPGHSVVPTGGAATMGRSLASSASSTTGAAAGAEHTPDGLVVQGRGAIAGAPFGSAMILPITWMYLRMMGRDGLKDASMHSILTANYLRARLQDHYEILFTGPLGMVAHEFIVDLRPFKPAGVSEEDVAKRLMDFGFHAPTMSWPVAGTLMIEPTESEDIDELDRFVEAMIQIREEIKQVEAGTVGKGDNVLKNAPHTADMVTKEEWEHPYSRDKAAFPLPWVRERKVWPSVGRVDNVFGDRHVVCSCPPMSDYE